MAVRDCLKRGGGSQGRFFRDGVSGRPMAPLPLPSSSQRGEAHRIPLGHSRWTARCALVGANNYSPLPLLGNDPVVSHRGRFFDGWRSNTIRRDSRLSVGMCAASGRLADAQKRVPTEKPTRARYRRVIFWHTLSPGSEGILPSWARRGRDALAPMPPIANEPVVL